MASTLRFNPVLLNYIWLAFRAAWAPHPVRCTRAFSRCPFSHFPDLLCVPVPSSLWPIRWSEAGQESKLELGLILGRSSLYFGIPKIGILVDKSDDQIIILLNATSGSMVQGFLLVAYRVSQQKPESEGSLRPQVRLRTTKLWIFRASLFCCRLQSSDYKLCFPGFSALCAAMFIERYITRRKTCYYIATTQHTSTALRAPMFMKRINDKTQTLKQCPRCARQRTSTNFCL